ncbi:T9SS type A sorting domain-containing protein [Lewinella sp. LCG006]|uniref:T9SS type A sorting domain-containing protein n=1 Tax=Lewinella sp. LCG006 TaxID=3231911 RepID=UPI00345FC5C9
MKTVVSTFLALFFTVALFAQNFVADEFIVEYVGGTTHTQQQAVRDLFGITTTTNIGDGIELWEGIQFPITVTESGETTIINDVEALLYYINIQEGEEGQNTNTSASINNGNLNLLLQLEQDGAFNEDGTFDPLPYCDEEANSRLFSPVPERVDPSGAVRIIIIDQLVFGPGIGIIQLASGPENLGGTHGQKVYSVIDNILSQTELENVEYTSAPVFNSDGTATVATLIEIINYIMDNINSGLWSSGDMIILNFSANIVFPSNVDIDEIAYILSATWGRLLNNSTGANNIMLVSSVGNQGLISGNVFPGTMPYANEISVAGTQNCFALPWDNTNQDQYIFEIAAESENVLTTDGVNYFLSNGTSFAAPLVTAALAQIFYYYNNFGVHPGADVLKNTLLSLAQETPALMGTVQNGRVLDISDFNPGEVENPGNRKLNHSSTPTPTPLTLTPTPNPFTTTALVTIQLPEVDEVTISMYNMVGQLVHQEVISNQQEMTELEWPTPRRLARGTYLLRVQSGEAVAQTMVVKQ